MNWNKQLNLLIGPVVGILLMLYGSSDTSHTIIWRMIGVVFWVAWWWMTEAVNLAVTSLLPFVLLPILGIVDSKTVAEKYFDQIIFLFIGGFMISYAIEKWNLHQRLSLSILMRLGKNPSYILAAVMGTSFFISMWMSNTATVMMLITAVLAIYNAMKDRLTKAESSKVATALLLGLAYAASLGGMATLVGTPTNLIFYSKFGEFYPNNQQLTFASWLAVGFPVALGLLVFNFLVLRYRYIGSSAKLQFDRRMFATAYEDLGKFSYEEKIITAIGVTTALLWFTRSPIKIGSYSLFGWGSWFPKDFIQDSTVAIAMALLLFLIPSKQRVGERILHWSDVQRLPFGIVLLFGGGFALAKGFEVSGLDRYLAQQLDFLHEAPPILLLLGVATMVCIISELASNVASIQLVLPILKALQITTGLPPILLMMPATLAASLGFMLPVATAPNTIVFGTGLIELKAMYRVGFWLDIIGIVLIVGLSMLLIPLVFGG